MRAQSEIISTVIIVSVALIIALGLVYYFTPLLAHARLSQQLYKYLTEVAAGISTSLDGLEYSNSGFTAVISIENRQAGNTRFYLAVLPFNDEGLPRYSATLTYAVYNMTNNIAVLEDDTGWSSSPLESIAVPSTDIYIYVKDDYYQLSRIIGSDKNIVIYDCGIIPTGSYSVYKVVADSIDATYNYAIIIFIKINNNYYMVNELPLMK